jgi:hypothetical protein
MLYLVMRKSMDPVLDLRWIRMKKTRMRTKMKMRRVTRIKLIMMTKIWMSRTKKTWTTLNNKL